MKKVLITGLCTLSLMTAFAFIGQDVPIQTLSGLYGNVKI